MSYVWTPRQLATNPPDRDRVVLDFPARPPRAYRTLTAGHRVEIAMDEWTIQLRHVVHVQEIVILGPVGAVATAAPPRSAACSPTA